MGAIIGIDPGVTGALAEIRMGRLMGVHDMPTMAKGKGRKQQINAAALADILAEMDDATVFLEQVSAMPGQGVSSMFGFGDSFGCIRGVCAALRMPVVLITPQRWKKHFGLIGADKDLARTRAQELYPAAPLARKKDVGRADAILIARYGIETAMREAA